MSSPTYISQDIAAKALPTVGLIGIRAQSQGPAHLPLATMVFPALARRAAASAAQQQRVARSALRSTASFSPVGAGRGVSSLAPPSLPKHRTGDVSGIVAGVAIVGAIVGVGKMWWDASSSPAAGGRAPAAFQDLSQAEVAGFFRELLAQVQQLFVRTRWLALASARVCMQVTSHVYDEQKQIPEIENAMRSYMKSNGMELDDAQFKQALMQQLFQMMEALEQEVRLISTVCRRPDR